VIFLLAFKNLLRHKKNTLLLILLIAFITSIFFLGNSILSQTDTGLKQTYIDNLTADLMVQRKGEITMNLFGANTPVIDSYFTIPTLPAYQDIRSLIDDLDSSLSVSVVSAKAVMDVLGVRLAVPLTGIEAPDYFNVFPGVRLDSGRLLQPDEFGVMITKERAQSIETQSGKTLEIGTPVKFTSASSSTYRIREVPLVGIYSYINPGPYMDQIILIDPQTVRSLSSVLSVASEEVIVADEALDLLEDDLDDLFTGELDFSFEVLSDHQDLSLDDLRKDLISEKKENTSYTDGDWNFILLRVNDELNISKFQKELNSLLDPYDLTVVDWRTAAGNAALMILLLQKFFSIGIILIAFAGGISIVNIVLISVFRRTKEIGTLRAIGASDKFIGVLIVFENFLISFLAGLLGILLGFSTIFYVNSLDIVVDNEFISSLLGQSNILLIFQTFEAIKAVGLALILGFFSSLYPSWQAIRILPIEAVRRG
jgi:putative ABC transport system permease protein